MKASHILRILAFVFAIKILTVGALAIESETRAYNWYCKNNDSHTIPILDPAYEFIYDYDGRYCNKKAIEDDKVIYLTFDAGYENGNITKILDIMKMHHVKGAFFILENLIKRDTELVKRMTEEGHLVCNHTKSHSDMTKITEQRRFNDQLIKLAELYKEYTGNEIANYYRPPEGRFSEQNLRWAKELGYRTVFWSFAYADWDNNKQPDTDDSYKKIIDHTHNGEVILLHPTSAVNAAILDRLLCEWEQQGYRFGSLDELYTK